MYRGKRITPIFSIIFKNHCASSIFGLFPFTGTDSLLGSFSPFGYSACAPGEPSLFKDFQQAASAFLRQTPFIQ
ncbi:MAG TPA: hypothetical protein DCZ05_03260 [Deltaproteobacteria bacterium]|nr:MAG: hypothetical protein A2X89_02875 [Deltaproteobacteria bacterium GWD2_55_8]HBA38774.1 hypothetical protein [Deltaproteobacteria bacterium]